MFKMDHSAFVGLWKSNVSGRRWGVFFKKKVLDVSAFSRYALMHETDFPVLQIVIPMVLTEQSVPRCEGLCARL